MLFDAHLATNSKFTQFYCSLFDVIWVIQFAKQTVLSQMPKPLVSQGMGWLGGRVSSPKQ